MTMLSQKTQFEARTHRGTLVAIFDTHELAMKWLADWAIKNPVYASSLKLFKVTTHTYMEAA